MAIKVGEKAEFCLCGINLAFHHGVFEFREKCMLRFNVNIKDNIREIILIFFCHILCLLRSKCINHQHKPSKPTILNLQT
jgi:hypothetical protein